jgi:hypothetical protein
MWKKWSILCPKVEFLISLIVNSTKCYFGLNNFLTYHKMIEKSDVEYIRKNSTKGSSSNKLQMLWWKLKETVVAVFDNKYEKYKTRRDL